MQLVVDPRNRDTVYAVRDAFGNAQVFETTNAGQSWTNISNNLPSAPAWSLAIDPRTGYLYLGNDVGVFVSRNGGTTWSRLGNGLPTVQVKALELNQNTNFLTIGTDGAGIWQYPLDSAPGTQQVLTLNNAVIGSTTFYLTYNSQQTATLTYNGIGENGVVGSDDADNIQNALNSLSSITSTGGYVTVSANATDTAFTVSFVGGTLAGTTLAIAPTVTSTDGATMTQTFTYNGALTVLGGQVTWAGPIILGGATTLNVEGTQALPNGVSAAQLTVSNTISDLTAGSNPTLTKTGVGNLVLGNANTFGGAVVVQQGQLVIDNSQALGATESQLVKINAGSPNDSFTLTFEGKTTPALSVSDPNLAADVQTYLDNLSTIGGAGGSVLVSQGTGANSNVYTVNFLGTLAEQPLPQFIAIPTSTTATPTTVNVNTVVNASGTTVDAGAALVLETGLNLEPVTLNGDGIEFNGHYTGALRSLSSNNVYTGTITLATNSTIGVDTGGANPGTLTIGNGQGLGSIQGNGFSLVKELPGTLVLDDPNSFGLASGSGSFLLPIDDTGVISNAHGPGGNNPIVVTTASTNTLSTGETVVIAGVSGFAAVNSTWTITVLSNTTFSLNGSTGITGLGNGGAFTTAFANGIVVSQGVLDVENGSALGAAANTVTVLDTAQLQLQATQQLLTLNNPTASTTFKLSFNGSALTANILYTGNPLADSSAIQTALNNLSTISNVGASVTVSANAADTVFAITFTGWTPGRGLAADPDHDHLQRRHGDRQRWRHYHPRHPEHSPDRHRQQQLRGFGQRRQCQHHPGQRHPGRGRRLLPRDDSQQQRGHPDSLRQSHGQPDHRRRHWPGRQQHHGAGLQPGSTDRGRLADPGSQRGQQYLHRRHHHLGGHPAHSAERCAGEPGQQPGRHGQCRRQPSAGRQSADGSRGTERHQRGADPERHRVSQRRRPGKQPGRRQHSQPVGAPSPWHPTPPFAPTPAPLCKSAAACKMPARSRSRP